MAAQIAEIDAPALAAALASTAAPTVIDVRADWEFGQAALPGSRHVPLAALVARGPGALAALPEHKHAPMVTVCHHGVRSAKAAQVLIELGYTQVKSLRGGIDAWSCRVDAQVPRY